MKNNKLITLSTLISIGLTMISVPALATTDSLSFPPPPQPVALKPLDDAERNVVNHATRHILRITNSQRDNLLKDIKQNQRTLQTQDNTLQTQDNTLQKNQGALQSHGKDIEKNKTNLARNVTEINTNRDSIRKNANDIEQNQSDILENSEKIASVKKDAKSYIDSLTVGKADYNRLDEKINTQSKKANAGIAAALAAASIPQNYSYQYNVGVAAADYNGEQALAIGFQYKIRENLVTNTNVAMDSRNGSGVGAGISLGW